MNRFFYLLLFQILPCICVNAQPELSLHLLRSSDFNWYSLSMYVGCNGAPDYNLPKESITIMQDDEMVLPLNFSITQRPAPDKNTCFDVVLVFDNSPAMANQPISQAISAGKAFVAKMDLDCQRVAVVSASSTPRIWEFLSNDKQHLNTALDSLSATMQPGLFTGIQTGIQEIITNSPQQLRTRALIVLTSGSLDSSQTAYEALVSTARTYGIRIFPILVTAGVNDTIFRYLASETGGSFYQVSDVTNLSHLYAQLVSEIQHDFYEYTLLYLTPNIYPSTKTVTVSVKTCNDSATATKTFQFFPPVSVQHLPGVISKEIFVEIFPHPSRASNRFVHMTARTSDRITLTANLLVYDILGRNTGVEISQEIVDGKGTFTIPISGFSPGIYFYQILASRFRSTGMITVTK